MAPFVEPTFVSFLGVNISVENNCLGCKGKNYSGYIQSYNIYIGSTFVSFPGGYISSNLSFVLALGLCAAYGCQVQFLMFQVWAMETMMLM